LRYNSLDTQTRSSGSGQRLMTLLEMPEEPTVSEVKLTDNGGLDRESFRMGTFFICWGQSGKLRRRRPVWFSRSLTVAELEGNERFPASSRLAGSVLYR
jgi:hypothetical protein